jgi:hypothetical protein
MNPIDCAIEHIKIFRDGSKDKEINEFCCNLISGVNEKETQFICSLLCLYLVNITMRDYDDNTVEYFIKEIIHEYRDLKEHVEIDI